MNSRPSHRSSALRVLVGGTLAAGLAGASAAWACTPQAFTVPRNQGATVPVGGDVVIEGYVYTHKVIDRDVNGLGRADLDDEAVLGAAFRPVEVEVHEGATVDEARQGRALTVRQAPAYVEATRLKGPEFEAKVTLSTPGLNFLWTFAINQDGDLVRPQPFVYEVQSGTVPTQAADETPAAEGTAGVTTPAPETVTSPVGTGQTTAAPSASQPTSTPAPAAAGTRPSTNAPATATASAPSATSAPSAAAARQAVTGSAAPAFAGSEVTPSPAPQTTDLWSGLNPTDQAPSLLDGSSTPATSSGSPIGAGLLGIGVVALAGVAVVAGQRKLALARRSR